MSAASTSRERLTICVAGATGRIGQAQVDAALLDADWNAMRSLAAHERVAPLLYRAVTNSPAIPLDVLEDLRHAYRTTAVRVGQLRSALVDALRVFDTAGVQVLLLKGAALSCGVWTDRGLRPWSDLDVCVRRDQVAAAIHALAPLGYTSGRMETTVGATVAHESELLLAGPGGVLIDLHWSLFDSPHYQSRAGDTYVWDHARAVVVDDAPAWILTPELLLLHLCGHLVLHHTGDELLWLNDVAELVALEHDRLNWDLVLAEAQALDLVLALQRTLTTVTDTLAAPVPPPVLARLQALRPSPAERAVVHRLTDRERSMAARLWLDITTMGSWTDRWAFARTRLFPSRAYMRARYGVAHPVLIALAYPYRWLIGLRRGSIDGN